MASGDKVCKNCNVKKPIERYSIYDKNKQLRRNVCRDCRYSTVAYSLRKEAIKERQIKLKRKAIELFGDKCYLCEEQFPDYCYDFHHIDESTKEMNPSYALYKYDFEKALKELEKCILVCSNCHRKIHFGEYTMNKQNKIEGDL